MDSVPQDGKSQRDSWWGRWKFSSDLILLSAFCSHGVHSACNKNKYQEFPWGLSAAGAYSWQICRLGCAWCHSKDGNPNTPSPLWALTTCYGKALPLPFSSPSITCWNVTSRLRESHNSYIYVWKTFRRRPLTAEERVRSQASPCGICGGQTGSRAGVFPSGTSNNGHCRGISILSVIGGVR